MEHCLYPVRTKQSVWQFVNDQDDTANTNYKNDNKKKTTLRGHSSPVKKITEYPDANKSKIMTTSDDGTSRIFNIELATAESDPPGIYNLFLQLNFVLMKGTVNITLLVQIVMEI